MKSSSISEDCERLLKHCRRLVPRFSQDEMNFNAWQKRLFRVVAGLHFRRVIFGDGTTERFDVYLPQDVGPESLTAAQLVSLTVVLNSPMIWRRRPAWPETILLAKTLAAELIRDMSTEKVAALDHGVDELRRDCLVRLRGRSLDPGLMEILDD